MSDDEEPPGPPDPEIPEDPIENPAKGEVTRLLECWDRSTPESEQRLLTLLYDELHRLASSRMRDLPSGQTLQPTALVHEAYVKLVATPSKEFSGRAHFFAAASRAMRNILVDRARRKGRHRHGGDHQRQDLSGVDIDQREEPVDHVALDEALKRLATRDPVKSDVVTLRYFGGLGIDETAEALGLSPSTVDRHWRYARAWLRRELEEDPGGKS